MAVFSGKPSSTGDFCRQPRTVYTELVPYFPDSKVSGNLGAKVSYRNSRGGNEQATSKEKRTRLNEV